MDGRQAAACSGTDNGTNWALVNNAVTPNDNFQTFVDASNGATTVVTIDGDGVDQVNVDVNQSGALQDASTVTNNVGDAVDIVNSNANIIVTSDVTPTIGLLQGGSSGSGWLGLDGGGLGGWRGRGGLVVTWLL